VNLPMFQIKSGRSRDDDSPWVVVSVIASPGWYWGAAIIAAVVALAVLAR